MRKLPHLYAMQEDDPDSLLQFGTQLFPTVLQQVPRRIALAQIAMLLSQLTPDRLSQQRGLPTSRPKRGHR